MDPDFGVKTSLRLASNRRQRNKCRINTEVGSEIPELGLDTGRVKLDCDLNPARMANAAARVARNYSQMRRQRQRAKGRDQPYRSSDSRVKRKRTRINIDTEYEKTRGENHDDDDGQFKRPSSGVKSDRAAGDDDEEDDD